MLTYSYLTKKAIKSNKKSKRHLLNKIDYVNLTISIILLKCELTKSIQKT